MSGVFLGYSSYTEIAVGMIESKIVSLIDSTTSLQLPQKKNRQIPRMIYLQLFNLELPYFCLPQDATKFSNRLHQKTTYKMIPLTKTQEGMNQM